MRRRNKKNIFEIINGSDALAVLKELAGTSKNIEKEIEKIAVKYLKEIDVEDVAESVFFTLDTIDVEELWDKSGSTRYGYVEPGDAAVDMFEDEMESYMHELKKYQELSMHEEAKKYCMGMLKGIYRFDKESGSKYREWAEDVAGEEFGYVLTEWKNKARNKQDIKEMEEFIRSNCPDWN